MTSFSKNITLLLTSLFLLPLPLMAQKDNTSKETAKQAKKIQKMLPKSEKFNGINSIRFEKIYECVMSGLNSEQQKELQRWERNNEVAMKYMPDIIYLGSQRRGEWGAWPRFGNRYEYKYNFVPTPGKNLFPNQTLSLADMNKIGAGYFYSDENDWIIYFNGYQKK